MLTTVIATSLRSVVSVRSEEDEDEVVWTERAVVFSSRIELMVAIAVLAGTVERYGVSLSSTPTNPPVP